MPGTWPKPSAAGLAQARDAGDLYNQVLLLPRIAELDLRAGRTGDAGAHLREGLRLAVRTGNWVGLRTGLSQCGDLCAATGRAAEALTLWAACAAADQGEGPIYPPWFVPRQEEQQRQARQALGPGRARAAEERGAAMSLAIAAEYAREVQRLIETGNWAEAPAFEDQLPDEWMPEAFFAYWSPDAAP